jgi:shikimate dehydrogenase
MLMEKYAIIGWPVSHSLSPAMQEAGFRALGRNARYELCETSPAELPQRMEQLRRDGYRGWNVTVPHKEQVFAMLEDCDEDASCAGSVNTIVNRDGRLYGYSTDGYGLAAAVQESFGIASAGSRQLFLGTGGAARAAAVYAAVHGAAEIILVNRTLSRAESLAEDIRKVAARCPLRCLALADSCAIAEALRSCDLLIQCTSLGLHAEDPLPFAPPLVPARVAVMDMIYGFTPFREQCAAKGCPTADGSGMLLHQGCRSLQLWTGQDAPVDAMRQALSQALATRQQASAKKR